MLSSPPTPPSTTPARLPRTVLALGVTSLFADVGSDMIFPLLPVFVASIGASAAFLGLVEGMATATSSMLKLASGYIADRGYRRRPFVLFGYGVAALVRPLMALATSPWHVLAVRLTDRVGKGVRSAPRDVLIVESTPQQQIGRAFGFHRAMDHAGAVVGPLIGAALLGLGWSLRGVFWFALIPGLLSVLAVATVREPHALASERAQRSSEGAPLSRTLRRYLLVLLLFSLGNSSDAFLLLRARELGVSVAALPLLWTVFHVAKLVSSYLGGDLSDRIPRPRLIACGWLVFAATYLGFGVADQGWQVWVLFVLYGSYYGLTEPAEKALVGDLAASAARGRAFGFYNFVVGISAVPAGVLTGWLWERWSARVALGAGAATALLASFALMIWNRTASSVRSERTV